jgi:DNA-directed RNA polymerase I and III subunit RPAC2
VITNEDHTLGNSLRYILMKEFGRVLAAMKSHVYSPRVNMCGYAVPHPSEKKIHLRLQTHGPSALSPYLPPHVMLQMSPQ